MAARRRPSTPPTRPTRAALSAGIAKADRDGLQIFPTRALSAERLYDTVTSIPTDLEPEDLAFVLAELRRLGWE